MFLIPTCGRPESMKDLISACRRFGMPRAAVMVAGEMYDIEWPEEWVVHSGEERPGMVASTNRLFELHPEEPWYGFLNDRARPRQEGWIEGLLEHVNGGWANQKSLGVNPRTGRIRMKNGIMDGDLVRDFGWFWPPVFRHLWVDDAMEDLLYENGLFHQTEVEIEEVWMPKHARLADDAKAYRQWQSLRS